MILLDKYDKRKSVRSYGNNRAGKKALSAYFITAVVRIVYKVKLLEHILAYQVTVKILPCRPYDSSPHKTVPSTQD